MKVSENLSIIFFPMNKEATKEGTPVYVRITISGQRKEWSTGIKINPNLWIKKKGRLDGKTREILFTNTLFNQIQANLEKHYLVLTRLGTNQATSKY